MTCRARLTDESLAGFATFDWLSLIDPISGLIVGTRRDDVLSAQADGDIVLGLAGNDRLSSVFNRTALIGGSGADTLNQCCCPLQGDAPVHGLAIQFGGTGSDELNATVTPQGGDTSQNIELAADVLFDGGSGNDIINAQANVALPVFGTVSVRLPMLPRSGRTSAPLWPHALQTMRA
jgi:serralysin